MVAAPARPLRSAVDVIKAEHRSIAAVLHGLCHLVKQTRDGGPSTDPRVFRAMLYYIDTFPERLHHPKEDRYLFRALRRRSPEAHSVIAELEAEHVRGVELIRALEQALFRYEEGGANRFADFAARVEEYAEFHWRHMRREEDVVLPLARRVLAEEDWREIDDAFAGHADPLLGYATEREFERLFTRIAALAPPPIGVGPAPDEPAQR
ncbi:MAG TPA: hemerythrin domain-containing protein [Burkholderiales bacterium]|nr:hemerythrin domain-containing protein [Burkholderiales bacterium]